MATIGFQSLRIRSPRPHSPVSTAISYPRSISIPLTPSRRLLSATASTHRRFNLIRPASSVTSPNDSVVLEPEAAEEEDDEVDPMSEVCFLDLDGDRTVGSITEWELDFCSRPILDERGKKVWELVVCDSSLSLQYTKYFPNNVINSITLRDAIASITQELGVPFPEKIRFFRSQMQTIITKACNELGIKPVPSKRCISLLLWLEERYETVYTRHPGFQKGSKPLLALDNPFPMELPENLFGERWAFVQLPYSAWMNGLEVDSMEVDTSRACLILSAGVATRYVYATYKKTAVTTKEAEAWEAAKKACGGLHFLAIQENLDSDDCVGFWLLLDLPPPPV
ncbi:protein TAB2 homolog, chloroplastic isoform X2 [Dendrobium catenatum]|uniref:protein TAB2 homolog, chloroplastic isoform X2 n=1 Tax=Dendrobium catenatum TaxID=906689 RepID=UPI0010A06FEE|nr:protein TAB2 homolog, chloroplastic isoform X2 [Dendrobium catenatum]